VHGREFGAMPEFNMAELLPRHASDIAVIADLHRDSLYEQEADWTTDQLRLCLGGARASAT
jgi:hypothetical protein